MAACDSTISRWRFGKRPALLYGYGGFNVSLTPSFARAAHVLLEQDGLYAIANLRGGGEYGETWHQAGMRERKRWRPPLIWHTSVHSILGAITLGMQERRR